MKKSGENENLMNFMVAFKKNGVGKYNIWDQLWALN